MRRAWVPPALIGGMLVFTVLVFGQLPDRIPTHWNIRGEVDGWGGRWSAFLMPAIALGVWLLMQVLPRIGPRRANIDRFHDTYRLLVTLVVGFLAVLHVVVLGFALGWPIDVSRVILGLLGLLFVALGNYLPRTRSNWWIGIRTPWTLESEHVWRRTHRLAGKTFVLAGVVTIMGALVLPTQRAFTVMFATIMVSALVPLIYSIIVWRREASTDP